MHYYGEEGDMNALVLELMGSSLERLFQKAKYKFTLKTTLMLVERMIRSLESMHSCGYIHRDVKPENYVTGLGTKSTLVHLLDFGLSKRFRCPLTKLHIPYNDTRKFTGTVRYASVNTHLGIEQSRRDDLESLGYLLVYFVKGGLPWQGVAGDRREKYEKAMRRKLEVSTGRLCKGLPVEFQVYLNYCRLMKFNQRPDYAYCIKLFRRLFERKGYDCSLACILPFPVLDHVLPPRNC